MGLLNYGIFIDDCKNKKVLFYLSGAVFFRAWNRGDCGPPFANDAFSHLGCDLFQSGFAPVSHLAFESQMVWTADH